MQALGGSIFDNILVPKGSEEAFEQVVERDGVRIERIISAGQVSADGFWYDQEEHEWVMLIQGKACIEFPDGSMSELVSGNYLYLPAHQKHRISYTSSDPVCIWLAVFWS
jgi:cupin 2 domain-containing protein